MTESVDCRKTGVSWILLLTAVPFNPPLLKGAAVLVEPRAAGCGTAVLVAGERGFCAWLQNIGQLKAV